MKLLSSLGGGFVDGLRMLFLRPRFQLMLLMMLGASWLGASIYEEAVVRDMPVAVLDFDNSHVAVTLRNYLDATPELRIENRPIDSLEQAETLMRSGELLGVLIIPSQTTASLTRGRRATVLFAVDMSNIVTGRTALRTVQKVVATVGGGVQLEVVRKLGEREEKAYAKVAPISVDEHISFNPNVNYIIYIVPAVIFFFLNVYVLLAGASLFLPTTGIEGGARRFAAAVPLALLSVGVGLLFIYGLLPNSGINVASAFPVVFTAVATLVLVDLLMAAGLAAFLPTPFLALEVTVLLGMLSMMLSGVTWPTDMFPPFLQLLAEYIPFTPFAKGLRMLLHYPVSVAELAPWGLLFVRQAILFASLWLVGRVVRWIIRRLRPVRAAEGSAS